MSGRRWTPPPSLKKTVGPPSGRHHRLDAEARHRASVSIVAEIKINGVRLYVEERGEGDPILGIHGTGSSAMAWGEAAETLSGLGRVIVYDRRGCTRSELPEPTVDQNEIGPRIGPALVSLGPKDRGRWIARVSERDGGGSLHESRRCGSPLRLGASRRSTSPSPSH